MTRLATQNKQKLAAGTAPLRNIILMETAVGRIVNRPLHLPGMAVFFGPSGFGKSTAAAYVAAKHQAVYLEVRSTWTKKSFVEALVKQLGLPAERTVSAMVDQAADELAASGKLVMLDEMDNAVERNLVELIRDIYELTKSPFLLIGEERLPQKLTKWERFHGRIMDFAQAEPADLQDAKILNRHYTPGVTVGDDLLQLLVDQAKGSVRRIVTNLERIQNFAKGENIETVTRAEWNNRPLHTAQTPSPRSFK